MSRIIVETWGGRKYIDKDGGLEGSMSQPGVPCKKLDWIELDGTQLNSVAHLRDIYAQWLTHKYYAQFCTAQSAT